MTEEELRQFIYVARQKASVDRRQAESLRRILMQEQQQVPTDTIYSLISQHQAMAEANEHSAEIMNEKLQAMHRQQPPPRPQANRMPGILPHECPPAPPHA